jgi:hypothetical protein
MKRASRILLATVLGCLALAPARAQDRYTKEQNVAAIHLATLTFAEHRGKARDNLEMPTMTEAATHANGLQNFRPQIRRSTRAFCAAALLLASASAAPAEWLTRGGEDPLTDQKWVATVAPFGQFAVTFKCWQGGSTQIAILIGPYDASIPYKDLVEVTMRVDKAAPIKMMMLSGEMAGAMVLQTSSELSDDVIQLLKQIGEAKERVVLGLGSVVLTTNAKGAATSVARMIAGCGIPEKTS